MRETVWWFSGINKYRKEASSVKELSQVTVAMITMTEDKDFSQKKKGGAYVTQQNTQHIPEC